ncbi:unnamed protein product [Schistocephalus solidus]|uniref:Aromatic-L-amino-acid decarboxylase n=1 Tax=Schistocephalus solidus TaxID=70667 RepID=A0A183SUD6_SCHSO|nr:unnamed protein product [Schistocephalus solidus]
MERKYYEDMRTQCTRAVQMSADYLQSVSKHRVFPQVEPGYLRPLLPQGPPSEPEPWDQIFGDINKLLMPGVTHWNHPQFHAYLVTANSYPALCADIISTAIGGIGFTWASSPVSTELEVVMLDWMANLLKLPEFFLSDTEGGGVIQGSASESTFMTLLAARNEAIRKYRQTHPDSTKHEIMAKLVGYHSEQAHASVERAGLLSLLELRSLPCNEKFELEGQTLRKAVEEDVAAGRIPFYCAVTLGTTATCSYDHLTEIGPVCKEYNIWLHVDAAYAGSALICPEFRSLMPDLEYSTSFAFNPHKWLLMNFDLSILWLKNVQSLTNAFTVDASYLQHAKLGRMPDFRHWHIPLGRRCRSLKIWVVLRAYGVSGLQKYIRNHVKMAHYLEGLIVRDDRFEIVGEVTLGLVCFRIKNDNSRTRTLYERIEADGRLHLVPSYIHHPVELFFIRVAICYQFVDEALTQTSFNAVHWNHPNFHAYFVIANSYPALCADILSAAIGGMGFSWASSPLSTELEVVMLDWMANLLKLPEFFLSDTEGGGVIQGSASECTLMTLLTARNEAIRKYLEVHPDSTKYEVMAKLVGYHSEQAHASVKRAGLLSLLELRSLPCNEKFELEGQTLRKAVEEDVAAGRIPFYCAVTLGTTATCSYDRLVEIGPVCREYNMWLHVDAAYAGSALICPEFRLLMPGLEHVKMAHYLEGLIVRDGRFEIVGEVTLGLVCFRMKNDNSRTRILYERIEADGRLHLVPSYIQHPTELFFIRVAICYQFVDEALTRTSFNVISELTTEIFKVKDTPHELHN